LEKKKKKKKLEIAIISFQPPFTGFTSLSKRALLFPRFRNLELSIQLQIIVSRISCEN
jgi:hypothetical protein